MHAICIHEHGGPEALRYDEVSTSEPGAGEARVRIEAAGLNYIDVYHRRGPLSEYQYALHAGDGRRGCGRGSRSRRYGGQCGR